MKKVREAFVPPDEEEIRRFRFAALHWLRRIRKEDPELLWWAKGAVEDEGIFNGLLDLVSKHRISADDLLGFLQERRSAQLPDRVLRKRLWEGGKKWKR